MLRVSLLLDNHWATFSNSILTSDCNIWRFWFWAQRKVSSANNFTYREVASGRSLIKIRKSRGPKMEPWGTPNKISSKDD